MGLGVPLLHVRAEAPDESVFADAVEVDDGELAEMRGKFVSPGQITYFGVEMQTQWQTGSGEVLSAGMKMDMNFSPDGNAPPAVTLVPTVSIVTNAGEEPDTIIPGPSGPPDTVIASKGITNVSGVVQSAQAGGNENRINNSIAMDITISSGPVTENSAPQAIELASVSAQESTDSGSVALAGADQDGVQVYTYVPNQGEILQRIGSNSAGDGNIVQSARLVGDQHRVINTMTISAGFNATNTNTTFNNSIQLDLRNFY